MISGLIKVQLDDGAYMPKRAYTSDGGLDMFAKADQPNTPIYPHSSAVFDTGVHMEIPDGYTGLLLSKSGLDINHDLTCTSVIDSGYSGSIRVKLYNLGEDTWYIYSGDKIGQLIIVPVLQFVPIRVDKITGGERGERGFGSSGR